MPAAKGKKIPGGLPRRQVSQFDPDQPFVVGGKPLKYGAKALQPGEVVPPELIEAIPRLESWVRARRIRPLRA